ncbi:hypothetical protein GCM10020000_81630 [Streptomyces olivoverticillatus]
MRVGLEDVQADAYFPISSSASALLEAATVRQVRRLLVAEGLATDEEIDRHLANIATGRLDLATGPLISAWGGAAPEASGLTQPYRTRTDSLRGASLLRRALWVAQLEAVVQAQHSPEVRERLAHGQRRGREGLGGSVPLALLSGLMLQWLVDP